MKFAAITPKEFTEFAAHSPYKSFMQTVEIAKYRKSNGWNSHYLALKDGDKIKAATLLVSKATFLGKSTFIAPGGPLLDFTDEKLAKKFLTELKSYAKLHGGFLLQISPYYELIERDRAGATISCGFNHSSALDTLCQLGFKPVPHPSQPQYLFALDLKNKSTDTVFAELKRNTRNHIRKAEKMGVKIRELKREELNILKQITESTSIRRGFTDRPLSYYEQMYDLFTPKNEVKFIVAEADKIPLSAAMFMTYGDEVVYLFSGSDEKYMREYNAQYLIQWHMIKYAIDHGFKRYNFYGIKGLPKNGELDGIYDFKKGFTTDETGHVIELIGTFEASLSPLHHAYKLLSKLKNAH